MRNLLFSTTNYLLGYAVLGTSKTEITIADISRNPQQQRDSRQPIFYVYKPTRDPNRSTSAWSRLCPPPLTFPSNPLRTGDAVPGTSSHLNSCSASDQRRTWCLGENTTQIAESMLSQGPHNLPSELSESMVAAIANSLDAFPNFAVENFHSVAGFQVRMQATRGNDGTKCPYWHTDDVPLRWIQSLTGPGCEFVASSKGVAWENMANDNSYERVDERIATIHRVKNARGHSACWQHIPRFFQNTCTGHSRGSSITPQTLAMAGTCSLDTGSYSIGSINHVTSNFALHFFFSSIF